MLIGDFMISSGDQRRRGSKKISRPRKNLVMGWSGNLLQADLCLEGIVERLEENPSTKDLRAAFSHSTPDPGLGQVKIVGWLHGPDEANGFYWDTSVKTLVWGDEWFIGSGGPSFEASSAGYRYPEGDEAQPKPRDALEQLCGILAQLNCTDRLGNQGHEIGVGGGFEGLFWDFETGEFKYLDRLLFFTAVSRISENGKLIEQPKVPTDSLVKYEGGVAGDNSLLTISEGEGREVYVMQAAGGRGQTTELMERLKDEAGKPMDFEAEFYAGLLGFIAPLPSPAVPLVVCPWDKWKPCRGAQGRFELSLPAQAIEFAYREGRAEYEAAPRELHHIPADRLRDMTV